MKACRLIGVSAGSFAGLKGNLVFRSCREPLGYSGISEVMNWAACTIEIRSNEDTS